MFNLNHGYNTYPLRACQRVLIEIADELEEGEVRTYLFLAGKVHRRSLIQLIRLPDGDSTNATRDNFVLQM